MLQEILRPLTRSISRLVFVFASVVHKCLCQCISGAHVPEWRNGCMYLYWHPNPCAHACIRTLPCMHVPLLASAHLHLYTCLYIHMWSMFWTDMEWVIVAQLFASSNHPPNHLLATIGHFTPSLWLFGFSSWTSCTAFLGRQTSGPNMKGGQRWKEQLLF